MSERLTKVDFSNLDKVLFPKARITKGQVIQFYIKSAPRMLGLLANRAIVLTRYPNGVDSEGFYAKDAPKGMPAWVKTVKIFSETVKRDVNYILVNDLDTLIWLANLAAIEIHMPLSRVDAREKPDFVLFDIDPEPPAKSEDGINVAPIYREYSYRVTREFVHAIGKHLAKETEVVVSEFSDTKKPNKVFIDYTQNSHGKTMIVPYGLRATPNATVSTPLEWKEVKKGLKAEDLNLFSVVKRKKDPWKGILENRQKLEVK